MHIKKGDNVIIISGKNKGETGTVLSVNPTDNTVVVEGLNLVKKHLKPSQANPQGGIETFEAPIHASNVLPIDPKTGKGTRVGYEMDKDGNKVRVARTKKTGTKLD